MIFLHNRNGSQSAPESQGEDGGTDRECEGEGDGPVCEEGSSEEERGEGEMEPAGEDEGTKRKGGRRGKGGKQKRQRVLRSKARKVSIEKENSTKESEVEALSFNGLEKENFPVGSPTDPQNVPPVNFSDPLENVPATDPQDSAPMNSPTDPQCVSPITNIGEEMKEKESFDPPRSSGHRKRRRDTHSVSPAPPSGGPTAQVTGDEPLPDVERQCQGLRRGSGAVDVEVNQEPSSAGLSDSECLSPLAGDPAPKRQRRNTYSVSPQGQSPTVVPLPLSPLDAETTTTTPMSGSRKRRRTHSVSPRSSILVSSGVSMDTDAIATVSMATEEVVEDTNLQARYMKWIHTHTHTHSSLFALTHRPLLSSSSATDEMMALLDKRVADRSE